MIKELSHKAYQYIKIVEEKGIQVNFTKELIIDELSKLSDYVDPSSLHNITSIKNSWISKSIVSSSIKKLYDVGMLDRRRVSQKHIFGYKLKRLNEVEKEKDYISSAKELGGAFI